MQAYIVDYARTPFTPAFKGGLSHKRSDDFTAALIKGLVERSGVDPKTIEDVILGCAFPEGEQGLNMARLLVFMAGLPQSVAGVTVNRFCGSSMQTAHMAIGQIAAGMGDAYLAVGAESMTRLPMTGLNPLPNPELFADYPEAYIGMGMTAENLAKKYKIKRTHQEAFAQKSHVKASLARDLGHLDDEIVPVLGVAKDECVRPDTSLDKLATLPLAFDQKGSVTAGTSSPLTDGASALLICSEHYVKQHQLKPKARIVSMAVSGCAPEIMGIGPVGATAKALKRAGLTLDDIDIIELNEAFAAQSMAVIKDLKIDEKKLNIDGGALAIGHPLGASGARILGKAASLLQREKKRYGLATMCIGGGQGIATIIERA